MSAPNIPKLVVEVEQPQLENFLRELTGRASGIRFWTSNFESDGKITRTTFSFARWLDLRNFISHPPIVDLIERGRP